MGKPTAICQKKWKVPNIKPDPKGRFYIEYTMRGKLKKSARFRTRKSAQKMANYVLTSSVSPCVKLVPWKIVDIKKK